MKKIFLNILISLLILSVLLPSFAIAGPNENAGIVFDMNAMTYGNQNQTSIPSQPAGAMIRLDVYCTDVQNLDTYEFEIIYDETELAYVAASATNPITYEPNILTTNGGAAIGWMIDSSTPGIISIAYTLAGTDTLEAPEGEGLIADIVFQAQVATHGTVSFGNVRFYDSFGVIDNITNKGIAILYKFGNIDGSVTNSNTGEPIEGAIVSINDFSDTTGTDGTYFLEYVPIGIYDITCTAEAYYDTVDVVEVLEGQTVTIDLVLEPFPNGTLSGTVTDANNGEPIEDAMITATSQGKFEYIDFTNADGYYIIDNLVASEIVGNYIVTCDAGVPYTLGEVTNVEIIEDETTTIDFVLTSPIMVVEPLEIFAIVENIGGSTINDITLINIGTAPFDWHGSIVEPEQLREPLKIDFPTPPAVIAHDQTEPSLGLAPGTINTNTNTNHSEPVVNLTRGSTGWAYNVSNDYFYSFDTDTPGTANIINSSPNWVSFTGDFDSGSVDDATYYIIKYPDNIFARVDIETGIATDIGPIIGSGGSYNWTGISCDKSTGIMYAVETDINFTNLYTIDLATGTPTLIGATGIPAVIDIAVDGEGIIWAHDIVGDNIYTIDKTTGVGTLVGSTGFVANWAQGMSWDPKTDQVYLTAYPPAFRVLDRETGYCAYVGPLPGIQVCALGFIGAPWIKVEPNSGTIEPGSGEIVHATSYWLESFFPGQLKYADIVITPDPNCGEQTVNFTATFGSATPGSISGLVTLESTPYGSGNVEDILLTATSQIFPSLFYTAYPNSAGEYTIQSVYPGTYDVTGSLLYDYKDSTIVDVEVEEATNTPNIDFELNCVLGALQGTVTDGYGEPIEGATITALGDLPPSCPYCTTTNEDGYYEINPIIGQFYNFTCEAEDFVTYTDTFTVLTGETYVEDVIMGSPILRVEPDSYEVILTPETWTTRLITVYNDGDELLEWDSSIEQLGVDLLTNRFKGVTVPSMNAEVDPNQTTPYNPPTKEIWDVLFAYDVDTPSSLTGLVSAETDGNYLFTAKWADSQIVKFDLEGNFIEIFSISGVTCLRDLAYDGTYFYGSDAGNYIWEMDFDTQTLVSTIPCPVAVRSIAYDEVNDAFWVNSFSSDLKLVDRSGNVLNTIYAPPSMYGSAYDNISEGGPYLWIFTGTVTGGGCQVEQYNLNTLTLTGVTHSVSGDFPGTIAGGLFTSRDIVSGTWVLGGLAQGSPDILFVYEFCCPWLKIEPTSGFVLPGESQPVTATFDDTGQTVGTVLTANIHFIPNVGEEDTVFAELIVGSPITGTLDGYVKKASDLTPIEGAVVTATSVGDVKYQDQDTTNSDGYYIIPEIWEDTYNVSCFAAGYNIPATQTAVIVEDETTTVNFSLTQPTMDITPTSISETVSPSTPIEADIHIVNNGDGELAWDASIELNRGVETDYSNCTTGILEAKNGQANGGNGSNGFVAEENFKDDVTLHYDGPYDNNSIGLTNGGTFMVAARFTPTELGDYYGDYQLSNVEIFINDIPTSAILKVWEGGSFGDPGTEIYSEDITGQISQESWATIILSAPINLVSDNEYWVGYEVTHNAGLHPAGIDAGPAVDEKGDWIYLAPGPWDELQNLGLDFNWNIRAVLSPGIAPWITLTHNSGIVEAGGDSTVTVYFNTIDYTIGEILQANIDFVSTPDVGSISIPIEITVGEIGVGDEPESLETKLIGNFPNPFSAATTIKFSLKEPAHVTLSVYNVKGQLVDRLFDNDLPAGADYEVVWNETDSGKKLANGIYFYNLEIGKKEFIRKMILMK